MDNLQRQDPRIASVAHGEGWVLSDGTYVRKVGSGPAVIFVHGLGLDHTVWSNQEAAFSDRMTVVTYDLVGHGSSSKPRIEHSVALYVRQLLTVMDELGLAKATVVGFSLGGLIVRGFALAHPERLSGLGIMNTWFQRTPAEARRVADRMEAAIAEGPSASVDPALVRWFSDGFRERSPNVLERIARMLRVNDPESYISAYRVAVEPGTPEVDEVEKIACPCLVMTCDEDRGNSPGMAMRLSENIPDCELVILPGLRHMALIENSSLVNAALGRLFARANGVPTGQSPTA